MEPVAVTVTVDATHLGEIDAVAAALNQRGMQVDQVHKAIGMICGTVDKHRQHALPDVPGVASMQAAHSFRIPSPDASVQ